MDLQLGDERYDVLSLLGSGGMADVYEVEHRGLGRRFALKLLRPELSRDPSLKARFEREARAVAKLSSENIVAIVDSGSTAQGAPYFVMERLQGSELRRLLETEGALPLQRVLHIALDVCRALTVAHGAGVIHRDLKPENLFIVQTGEGNEHCKVLDFGIAKLVGENPTMPGTLMGTARYMAPEQIGTSSAVGPATDVFALGVILFECLTGEPPFVADTLERVLYRIVNDPPPPLLELRPELPSALGMLVERMLAKLPAERPQSAREVAEALTRLTFGPRATAGAADQTLQQEMPALPAAVGAMTAAEAPGRTRSKLAVALAFVVGASLGVALGRVTQRPPDAAAAPPPLGRANTVESPRPALPSASPLLPAAKPPSLPTTTAAVTSVPAASLPPASLRTPARPAAAATTATSAAKPPLFYPQEPKP